MSTPKVSVILPVTGPAPWLARALHSVLSQSAGDLELLVVHSDAAPELPVEPRLRRIELVRSTRAAALNAGVQAARGEWLAFQEPDGEWLPLRLARQLDVAQAPAGRDWIGGGTLLYGGGVARILPHASGPVAPVDTEDFLGVAALALPAWLIRRSALPPPAFDSGWPGLEEWDLLLRLVGAGRRYAALPDLAVLLHRAAGDAVPDAALAQRLLVHHAAAFRRHPDWRARWSLELAHRLRAGGDGAQARRWVGRALANDARAALRHARQRLRTAGGAAPAPGSGVTAGPLVTVILPTHNRAHFLGRSIESVLKQTYANLELIVVDDASKDATPDVVKAFDDSRLRYLRQPQNQRAAAARNRGIAEARGELVAFQDDDDIWLPAKLERQVAALLAAPHVGLSLCGHIMLTRDGALHVGGEARFRDIDFARGMDWRFGMIATPAWVVRKEKLLAAGLFDEGMKAWDDWEYALRLRQVCEFGYVDEPLFLQDQRRLPGTGQWDNQSVWANDMSIIMRRHEALWLQHPAVRALHYRTIGVGEVLFHSVSDGRRSFLQSWRAQPLQVRAPGFLLLSLLGRRGLKMVKRGVSALRHLRIRARVAWQPVRALARLLRP